MMTDLLNESTENSEPRKMPRKLTESAKRKREEKKKRVVEKPSQLPEILKQHTIEALFRMGWDAPRISREIGFPLRTVQANIKRYKGSGSTAPGAKGGRKPSAVTKRNLNRVRCMLRRNNGV
jgi:hypothetical protein